jgi:O-antigen/teichoic acid export membrane protein
MISAIAFPFALSFQPALGQIQGEQRFLQWSALTVLRPATALVCAFLLIGRLGAIGVAAGTSIGGVLSLVVAIVLIRKRLRRVPASALKPAWRSFKPFLLTGASSSLTVALFVSADVVAVQHYFPRTIAGQYSTVAAIGNILFSISFGVSAAVFPAAAARQAKGQQTLKILASVLGLFGFATFVGTTLLELFGGRVLLLFSGRSNPDAAHYIALYGLGMGILSLATVVLHTQQSRNKYILLWLLVPVAGLRVGLLVLFHQTVLEVVQVSDVLVGLFTLVLLVMYVRDERKLTKGDGLSELDVL